MTITIPELKKSFYFYLIQYQFSPNFNELCHLSSSICDNLQVSHSQMILIEKVTNFASFNFHKKSFISKTFPLLNFNFLFSDCTYVCTWKIQYFTYVSVQISNIRFCKCHKIHNFKLVQLFVQIVNSKRY